MSEFSTWPVKDLKREIEDAKEEIQLIGERIVEMEKELKER